MTYITNWEEGGIYWRLLGVVTSEEIFEFSNAFYESPKSDLIRYQIVDCLNVEKFELNKTTMAEIAALDYAESLSIKEMKVALVGGSDNIKMINQSYIDNSKKFRSNWKIKIFDNMNDARNWLSEADDCI